MVTVTRVPVKLRPNPQRVLLRYFTPGEKERIEHVLARILTLSEEEVTEHLSSISARFSHHESYLKERLSSHFERIRPYLFLDAELSEERKLFIGSFFTSEYSIEASALFNPSIVPHPDQSGLPEGAIRFVLSLRATGEGHISSLVFREGVFHPDGRVTVEESGARYVLPPQVIANSTYNKREFIAKLTEAGYYNEYAELLLSPLGEEFGYRDLIRRIEELREATPTHTRPFLGTLEAIEWLASFNQEVYFPPDVPIDRRVIPPATVVDLKGIEDARFVRFVDERGAVTYYATYTAYDGTSFSPQLLATKDFTHFRFISLTGKAVKNKGFALFPRKIGGKYCMLGRQDNETITLMFSDHLSFWNEYRIILRPKYVWEFIQMGNCGPPIETEAGWLVITHGVGPMRHYALGAVLLDREDPLRVLGRLRDPLLEAVGEERAGYVPNVLYSCGSLLHEGRLLIPYAMSDYVTSFAIVQVDELLEELLHCGP
ncbi:glycoside hydrolase family 130 protein [Spirochaeta thermophila]|uniref:Putative glycosidase n=1 Tax=Winmispira thermophila (strain ATCC 49972 / DSM 6192 / RI 19.B1) TaxID=665571 RepID=E0RP07_WINT6|nr:glycoside hydrolase family 130 protein [Spirochaeta thermophila]ADN02669.1 putative glycosidase [Spirochaeta thermophila DSM 6192]